MLVAAQPTRGLDVGAIEYMSAQLRERRRRAGVGVLLISTELEEILDLSDRIVVISDGRIVGEMRRGDVDLERLGLLMGGADARPVSPPMSDVGEHIVTDHGSEEVRGGGAAAIAVRRHCRGRRALRRRASARRWRSRRCWSR